MTEEYDVPPEAEGYRCDRCGRPFRRERSLALHRGLTHPDDLTRTEEAAFADARRIERDALARFRLKALGGLVLLYFGLLITYAIV